MVKGYRALIIEDNLAIAQQIARFLEGNGWQLDFAATGSLGITLALQHSFDVVLLDLNLPDCDGIEVCEAIRAGSTRIQPILMLTARDSFEDKQRGFVIGADDYLTKPFDLRELALRCEALARRPGLHSENIISKGALRIELRTRQAFWLTEVLPLTGTGFRILHKLLEAYPYPVSRTDLIDHLWRDDPPESNSLKSHMYSLRKVLEKSTGDTLIQTISSVGYQLRRIDVEGA